MSQRSKSKRSTPRKPTIAPATSSTPAPLQRVEQAQKRLDKAADIFRTAQRERRAEVERAFKSGASTQQLAGTLGVSRQKVYDLLGGVRSSKPSNAS